MKVESDIERLRKVSAHHRLLTAGALTVAATAILTATGKFLIWNYSQSPFVEAVAPAALSSLGRAVAIVIISLAAATSLAIVAYYYGTRAMQQGLFYMLLFAAMTPPTIWIAASLLVFGLSEVSFIAVGCCSLVFLMAALILQSFRGIHPNSVDLMRRYNLGLAASSRYVVFPECARDLEITARLGSFFVWMSLLVAENSGARHGVGGLLLLSRQLHDWMGIFGVWLLTMSLILVTDVIVSEAFRRLCRRWITRYGIE